MSATAAKPKGGYCQNCGQTLDRIRWRCPECRRTTAAFRLNFYSLAIWAALIFTDLAYVKYVFPPQAAWAARMGVDLMLSVRLFVAVVEFVGTWGPVAVAVLLAWALVAGARGKGLPGFLVSGKALAWITWLALLYSLAGLLAASQGDLVGRLR